MTLTIKLDRNWSSFQLANSAPPLSVTDSAIAPSARMMPSVAKRKLSQKYTYAACLCFAANSKRKCDTQPLKQHAAKSNSVE